MFEWKSNIFFFVSTLQHVFVLVFAICLLLDVQTEVVKIFRQRDIDEFYGKKIHIFWFIIISPNLMCTSLISSVSYFVLFSQRGTYHTHGFRCRRHLCSLSFLFHYNRNVLFLFIFRFVYNRCVVHQFFNHWPHQHQSIHVLEKKKRFAKNNCATLMCWLCRYVILLFWLNKHSVMWIVPEKIKLGQFSAQLPSADRLLFIPIR